MANNNKLSNEVKRVFSKPNQSYLLFGPRGTGKSTLAAELYPNALTVNLLLADIRRIYAAKPERLFTAVHVLDPGQTIIINEIQKVPALLTIIYALIEEKRGWQFVLTGSSSRKLKRDGVDLLAGRALQCNLHPFMACELGDDFDYVDVLKHGLLPLRFGSDDPKATLSAYVSLYLDEEVKFEGLVRQVDHFTRFLEVLSFSHCSVVNLNNIAREASVKRSTAEVWLSIVFDLLIAYEIPIFNKKAKRHLASRPKFYFFDAGVYRALRPTSILDEKSEINGGVVEGLVAQHLRAWVDYTKKDHKLYFWRTKSGLEVDFVVFGEMGLWAIEVKNSEHIHPKSLTGLREFQKDYPMAKLALVYQGKERQLVSGVLCIPCEEFLLQIVPDEMLF